MSSFDDEDRRAKYALVPKSSTQGKVVKVQQKTVETKVAVRKVLPEEQYIENLEKIITKDYFPELDKLKAQKEYMDAVARNDIAKIHELRLRYKTSRRTDLRTGTALSRASTTKERQNSPDVFDPETPGPSNVAPTPTPETDPYVNEMPYSNMEGDNEPTEAKKKKKDLSLTQYLNKFTSEDNASFEELTQVTRDREEAKRKWVHEAEEKHNAELITRSIMAKDADVQLALKNAPNADDARPNHLDNWSFTKWNTVLFNPPGADLTAEEALEAKRKNQTVINKSATRFAVDMKKGDDNAMNRAARFQAEMNQGKIDIMGNVIKPTNDFSLLKTPSPAPGIEASPLMTWGEIDGTPFRLDASDLDPALDNAPTFKMPEVPYRDQIAQGINDSIAYKYREKRKVAMKAAEDAHHTPRFGSSRLSLLSPAAQRLASSKLGIRLGSAKSKHTPSPAFSSSSSITPGTKLKKTPIGGMIRRKSTNSTPSIPAISSLTDGLLDGLLTPTTTEEEKGGRAKAGDFF